jgi:hypothetical protein
MAWQTMASEEVLRGQEYWRLTQALESSGDIFEIDVSAKGLAIGPDSDVGRVNVTYYDPSVESNIRSVSVGVGNPFSGRLDSLNATPIAGTGDPPTVPQTPARLLIHLNDIVDNAYQPYDQVGPNPLIIRVQPIIDFFTFLSDPTELPRERSDKTSLFSVAFNTDVNSVTYYMVPYYGRRFARATLTNQSGLVGTGDQQLRLRGIRLNQGAATVSGGNVSGQLDLGEASYPPNGTVNLTTFAREDGQFDLLQVEVDPPAGMTAPPQGTLSLRVDVSDRES